MARLLAEMGSAAEADFAVEFEEPSFATLGICYEKNGRFAGSVYQPILKRVEEFLEAPMTEALEERARRAERLLEADKLVAGVVKSLKDKGFDSPYLKNFVVARVNPVRFSKSKKTFDEALDAMIEKLEKFDIDKVTKDQISGAG
jgi:ParB family chromosome partitioning protein